MTLHARVTEETRGFIGRAAVRAMKQRRLFRQHRARPDGRLRRAVRGAEIRPSARRDARDLRRRADARRTGHCCGSTNVTLTPHIAGASIKTVRHAAEAAAEEVRRYLAGEGPLNPC